MATFKAYPNGGTMGRGNPTPVGGPRGEVNGWSASAVRRHKRWLYSVDAAGLTGPGQAVTLTLRDTPASHTEWAALLKRFLQRLRDAGVFTRWHWVVEWQRRGTPHLHLAVYGDGSVSQARVGAEVIRIWMDLTREPYRASNAAQTATPITGPVGWLKYLSKHASRGVAHYQRQGKPAGWEKTGRLWGYGGDWPTQDPIEGELSMEAFYRIRRMAQRYAIADARTRQDFRAVAWLRGSRKCPDRALSSVRGISDWLPQDVFLAMAFAAGWDGELVAPEEEPAA